MGVYTINFMIINYFSFLTYYYSHEFKFVDYIKAFEKIVEYFIGFVNFLLKVLKSFRKNFCYDEHI